MLQERKFKWGEEQEASFVLLKEKLYTGLVVTVSNFDKLFKVKYNASSKAIGTVLSKKGLTINYLSEKLNESQ